MGSSGFGGTGWEKRGDRRGTFGHGAGEGGRVFGGGRARDGQPVLGVPPSTKPAEVTESFAVGDSVDHKAFGRGRVIAVKGDQLSITFERTGETKKLLVGYAPIVKIKP